MTCVTLAAHVELISAAHNLVLRDLDFVHPHEPKIDTNLLHFGKAELPG